MILIAGGAGNALRKLFGGNMAEGRKSGVVRRADFDQVFQKNKLPTLTAAQAFVVGHERAVAPAIRPELECRKIHRHVVGQGVLRATAGCGQDADTANHGHMDLP